jgi:hypothetical protein
MRQGANLIGTLSPQLSCGHRIAVTDSILSILAEIINCDSKRPGPLFHNDRQRDLGNKGPREAVATRKRCLNESFNMQQFNLYLDYDMMIAHVSVAVCTVLSLSDGLHRLAVTNEEVQRPLGTEPKPFSSKRSSRRHPLSFAASPIVLDAQGALVGSCYLEQTEEDSSSADELRADSVRRKRKRKMNKHKHAKRRKANRHQR